MDGTQTNVSAGGARNGYHIRSGELSILGYQTPKDTVTHSHLDPLIGPGLTGSLFGVKLPGDRLHRTLQSSSLHLGTYFTINGKHIFLTTIIRRFVVGLAISFRMQSSCNAGGMGASNGTDYPHFHDLSQGQSRYIS